MAVNKRHQKVLKAKPPGSLSFLQEAFSFGEWIKTSYNTRRKLP
jgi:hypothetical protein